MHMRTVLAASLVLFLAGWVAQCATPLNLPAEQASLLQKRDSLFTPQYEKLNEVRFQLEKQGRALRPAELDFLERMQALDETLYAWEAEVYKLEEGNLKGKAGREKVEALNLQFPELVAEMEAMFKGYPFQ